MPPSAEWDALGNAGDAFYCRTQLYTLAWQFPGSDLSDYIVAGAPNGGPVALTRDESKPVLLTGAGDGNAVAPTTGKTKRVSVYSSAGILLQSITVRSDPVYSVASVHLIMLTRLIAVGSRLTDRKDRMDCKREPSHPR